MANQEVYFKVQFVVISDIGEREGNQKITTSIQYTMVVTAYHPVTPGFSRKDVLLFPFHCQEVLQKRCMQKNYTFNFSQ